MSLHEHNGCERATYFGMSGNMLDTVSSCTIVVCMSSSPSTDKAFVLGSPSRT